MLPLLTQQRTYAASRSAHRLARALLACVFALAWSCASTPPVDDLGWEVESDGLGMRLDLDDWVVYREAADAPLLLRGLLGSKAHPDDSPVFIALSRSNPSISLVDVVAATEATPRRYFEGLVDALPNGTDLFEARMLPGGRAGLLSYGTKSGLLYLRASTLVFVHEGQAHQLIVSTAGESDHLGYLTNAVSGLELRTDGEWQLAFESFPGELAVATRGPEQAGGNEPFDAVECEPGDGPLLFRAEGPDGVAYLFGSIHFGRESFFPFAAPIEDAFSSASRLAVELDMRSANTPEIQRAFARAAALDGHSDLESALSPEAYHRLRVSLEELGLPAETLDQLEPWAVAMTLSALMWQAQGFDPAMGVDLYFLNRSAGKQIVELESLEQQLELLSSLDGEAFLDMTIDSIDHLEEDLLDTYRAWLCGDAALMSELFLERPLERGYDLGDFVERFLDERNERMAEGVAELIEQVGKSFVVVGAAHLVGPSGIPELLRARGLSVERQ